jgi:hypothetical protein
MATERQAPVSIAERQKAILAADPYLAGETVLRMALAQEHAWQCAWVPGHAQACDSWRSHVNAPEGR